MKPTPRGIDENPPLPEWAKEGKVATWPRGAAFLFLPVFCCWPDWSQDARYLFEQWRFIAWRCLEKIQQILEDCRTSWRDVKKVVLVLGKFVVHDHARRLTGIPMHIADH